MRGRAAASRFRAGASPRAAVSRGALWFGVFGAPFFWSVQLIVTYAATAETCFPRRQPLVTSSPPAAWTAVCIVIVCALVGSLGALATAVATCRATSAARHDAGSAAGEGRERRMHFMSYSGILLGVLFVGAVALSGVAVLLAPPCW